MISLKKCPDEEDSEALSHTEKEAFNSDPCDHRATFGPNLATDAVIHNGEQSYSRHLSDHKTKVKSTPRHLNATHSRQRRFACDHCNFVT